MKAKKKKKTPENYNPKLQSYNDIFLSEDCKIQITSKISATTLTFTRTAHPKFDINTNITNMVNTIKK